MDLDLFDLPDRDRRRNDRRRDDRARWYGDDDDHDDDHDARYARRARHRRDDDRDDDEDEPRYPARRRGRGDRLWDRRAHPHLFSWLLVGGGVVLFGIAILAVLSSLGLWGHLSDAYFAATKAILPTSWHDEWTALPGLAHVAIVLGGLFVAAGIAGEVLD